MTDPPPSQAQKDAAVAVLRAGLDGDIGLEAIVVSIWDTMRSVRNPVGRPMANSEDVRRARADLANGAALRQVRRVYNLSGSMVARLKRELDGV